jgi:hypothetical protein
MANLSETEPRKIALELIEQVSEKAKVINFKSEHPATKLSLQQAISILVTPLVESALQNGATECEILEAIHIGAEKGRVMVSKKPHLPLVRT